MSKQNVDNVKEAITNQDNIRNISIIAHIDSGKCFSAGTPIMMSDGNISNVEDIKVGDHVMGHNMKAGYVSTLHDGIDNMYQVTQSDDKITYNVNSRHTMVLELTQHYVFEVDETQKKAYLYYFNDNELITLKRTDINIFDKLYLKFMTHAVDATSYIGKLFNDKVGESIARSGSWVYLSIEDYLKLPDSVKCILKGVNLDVSHYNDTGKYNHKLVDINISPIGEDHYYGFEVKSNPLFLLSDGTIVHNSTLSDSLITKAGIIAADKAGLACGMDTREDEQERGITIKSCSVSLQHTISEEVLSYVEKKQETNGRKFLINLIDSPGHVDFSSEVTAALRVTDGAVVVVECIGGVSVQTKTVVRQAIQENIQLVLMINKMDRGIVELQLTTEELYQKFNKIIQDMNVLVSTYGGEHYPDNYFDPVSGNVVFGSAYHGWAFHLRNFTNMYAKLNGVDPNKLIKKLWGEHYININNKWEKTPAQNNARGFAQLVLEPIYTIYQLITKNYDYKRILPKVERLGIKLTKDEIEDNNNKNIVRAIMRKWIQAGDAVLETVIEHLPSPKTAQKYRGLELYTGDLNSDIGQAIVNCDANGPMTMFVSKMFPANDGRFYAFGRVFSGTIKGGQQVKIMGGNYTYGEKQDLVENQRIQRVVLMMASKTEPMDEVPCGNIVGLVGIDQYLAKTGTLSDSKNAYPIKPMKYSVSPVVRVAVEPKDVKDMNKLQQAMKKLTKSDPLVQCFQSDTGENIVAGAGELHIEICINDLKQMAGVDLYISDPVVPYCETIIDNSIVAYAKSSTGLNRILMSAQPVPLTMVDDIDSNKLSIKKTAKELTRTLIDNYEFDVSDFKRLWGFGAEEATQTNVLTDDSKGVDYLDKIKGSVISGFEGTSTQGVLASEPLRGVHFKLVDATVHMDSAHRGANEIIPATRKAIMGSMISGKPRLVEPIYLCEIYCPTEDVGTIYSFMGSRRGEVLSEEPVEGNPNSIMKSYLPVAESFGFTNKLREVTHGRAFPTCVFSHWQVIDSDPYEEGSYANKLVMEIRKRKGMKLELPQMSNFIDKMPKELESRYAN